LKIEVPSNLVTWLKIAGAAASGLASIVLAWRIRLIVKWVVYCLVTHEQSIDQLRKMASGAAQTAPMVGGVTKHLLDVQSKVGLVLLVVGFLLLGVGMLCNAVAYVIGG
jgi:hypothetical protein